MSDIERYRKLANTYRWERDMLEEQLDNSIPVYYIEQEIERLKKEENNAYMYLEFLIERWRKDEIH